MGAALKERLNEKAEQLTAAAWHQANLTYKLKPAQRAMKRDIFEWDGLKYVIKCSRRLGKSYLCCALSVEACLSKPFALVRYGAPTGVALKKIIIPIMREILKDCPERLRPEWRASDFLFQFPNGSQIHLAGLNTHPDHLRGTACDLFVIDEGGSVNDLSYVISDIAMPQFLDPSGAIVEGRRLLLAGSPPRTPAHDFTELANQAEIDGNYSHFTIYDGGYPDAMIDIFKEEAGGEASTTWQREYLARDVVDEDYALVPEWKEEFTEEPHLDEFFRFYYKYHGLDIGVRDLTVDLIGHYDFQKAILYIHDEFVISGPKMTTDLVAEGIRAMEDRLFHEYYRAQGWVDLKEPSFEETMTRVSDIDLKLIQDMTLIHKLRFEATTKESLEGMVNKVRLWVGQGRLRVSPRCKQLLGCLKYGVWNESRSAFERSKTYGHFDAFAALMYLMRKVNDHRNPIPLHYGKSADDYFMLERENKKADKLRDGFGLTRRNSGRR